jgi:hypothetical protein
VTWPLLPSTPTPFVDIAQSRRHPPSISSSPTRTCGRISGTNLARPSFRGVDEPSYSAGAFALELCHCAGLPVSAGDMTSIQDTPAVPRSRRLCTVR